jgi:von Willebrand factor type A domain
MTSTNTNTNIKEIDMTILNHQTQQSQQSPKNIIKNSYIMMHTATTTTTAKIIKELEQIHNPSTMSTDYSQETSACKQAYVSFQNFGILQIEISDTPMVTTGQDIFMSDDMSGSMEDRTKDGRTKIQHMIHTTKNLINTLAQAVQAQPLDINIAIDGFDDLIEQVIPLTKVTEDNVDAMHKRIDKKLKARNSTNIEIALENAKTKINQNQSGSQYKDRIQHHIFMTDGQVTKGSTDHAHLASLVDPNYSNIFIGFGLDHDAELLQALAANTNSSCYFVDNIENTGLIYGEILHGILYTALYDVKIEMQNGEIYDYKTNTWTTTLEIATLNSEAKKTYHVRTTTNQEISAIITGKTQPNQPQNVKDEIDLMPDLLEDGQEQAFVPVDLTKYMFRQRTMELLFEARTNNNKANNNKVNRIVNNNNITTIANNKKIIKDKLKAFLKLLQAQMLENKSDDDFYQTLCEDINIAYASFDSPVACMYTAARQHSQGRQLSYNVASPYDNQDQDQDQDQQLARTKTKYNYASPVKLRRQNALMMSPTQPSRGCDGAERVVTDPEYGTPVEYSNHSPTASCEYDEQFVLDDDDNDNEDVDEDDQIVAQVRRPCLSRSNTTPKQERLMRSVSEGTPYKQSPTFPSLMMPVNEGTESEIEALLSSLHQPLQPQPPQQPQQLQPPQQTIYLFPETDPELVEGLKSLSASISDSNIRHEMITAEIKALELEKELEKELALENASVRVQKEKMA